MAPQTRRRLLHGAAALLTGLAGCGRSSRRDSSDAPPGTRRGENVEEDPESYALRNSGERPPAWLSDERDNGATTDADATAGAPRRAETRWFVASDEAAARMEFADVDGAGEARQFASDTDFDDETLYVEHQTVGACRALELCHVAWSDTEIDTDYGSYYRDADVSCRADANEAVSWLIRVPDTLDPDAVRSYGSGRSSSGCHRRRPDRETGATTEAPDLGPATNASRTASGEERSRTTGEDER